MMKEKTVYYFTSIRFPSEKAHAVYVDQSMRAFAGTGARARVVAPRRAGRGSPPQDIPYHITYLPTVDLFSVPFATRIAFPLNAVLFALVSTIYAWCRVPKDAVILTNESALVVLLAPFFKRVVWEVHDYPERKRGWYRLVCRAAAKVMANNRWKAARLRQDFSLPKQKVFYAHNGVDIARFARTPSRGEARRLLSLPAAPPIALYTGHLYAWKGVGTLARAARCMPEVQVYFVGGTQKDLARMRAEYGALPNVHFVGHRPHEEMPLWQAAADVLVLPNTGKEALSVHYTSPMKLFEYLASGRPIVASDLPSVREVVDETCALLVPPDNPPALAQAVRHALAEPSACAARARKRAAEYTWEKRAVWYIEALER